LCLGLFGFGTLPSWNAPYFYTFRSSDEYGDIIGCYRLVDFVSFKL
jgi:hypothetical protein